MSLSTSYKVDVNERDTQWLIHRAVTKGMLTGSFLRYIVRHGFNQQAPPLETVFDDIDFYLCIDEELLRGIKTVNRVTLSGGVDNRDMGKQDVKLSETLKQPNRCFGAHQAQLYSFYRKGCSVPGLMGNLDFGRVFFGFKEDGLRSAKENVINALQVFSATEDHMTATVNIVLVDSLTYRAWNVANRNFVQFLLDDFGFFCSAHEKEFRKGFFEGIMGMFIANNDHGY